MSPLGKMKNSGHSKQGDCSKSKCLFKVVAVLEIVGLVAGYFSPISLVFGGMLAALTGAAIVLSFVTIFLIFYAQIKRMYPEKMNDESCSSKGHNHGSHRH